MTESPYLFRGVPTPRGSGSDYEDRYEATYGRKPFGSGKFWDVLIVLVLLGIIGGTTYAMLWRPDLLPEDIILRVIFGGSAILADLFILYLAALFITENAQRMVARLKGRPAKDFSGRLIDVKVEIKENQKDMRRSAVYTVTFEFTAYDNERIQATEKVVKPLPFVGGNPLPPLPPPGTMLVIHYVNKKRFSLG